MNLFTYEETLEKLKKKDNSFSSIARTISNKLKANIKLETATELANESNVSNATITKFVREFGFKNFNELNYVHNNIYKDEEKILTNENYSEAADLIIKARKILFIGVSGSFFINSDFANKLMRIDKWVVITPSKYEQIGLSKLLSPNDLVIVNSVSLQHKWMIDILKNAKCKKILVSGSKPDNIEVDHFFSIYSNERQDGYRVYTSKNRIATYEVLDNIFYEIYSREENRLLLQASSYK